MSAVSRGLQGFLFQHSLRLPSSLRVAVFSIRPQPAQCRVSARSFAIQHLRQYVQPSKILQAVARPNVRSYMSADPAIRTVQATKQPVLLYKAPERQLYMIGVYAFACSLVAGGLFTLRFRYDLPKDLPFFVGPTYVLVGFIMIAIGSYIFTRPVARCTSIELIPNMLGGAGVQLRIKARTVPIFKDKIIIAPLGDATINEKTLPVTRELIEADRARNQDITEGLRGMFIARRGWEITARFLEQKWTSFFLRFKFAVLQFGIVKLELYGEKWKIDCSGYLREDGQAIDRLIAQA